MAGFWQDWRLSTVSIASRRRHPTYLRTRSKVATQVVIYECTVVIFVRTNTNYSPGQILRLLARWVSIIAEAFCVQVEKTNGHISLTGTLDVDSLIMSGKRLQSLQKILDNLNNHPRQVCLVYHPLSITDPHTLFYKIDQVFKPIISTFRADTLVLSRNMSDTSQKVISMNQEASDFCRLEDKWLR
jgi:hypothetical protein